METPWISFKVDLSKMSPSYWMLLGEGRSKCDHLANVPMSPDYARHHHVVTLTKGVHATTAIEGNTLTEQDVERIVRDSPFPASDDYRIREVENVLRAYNDVKDQIAAGNRPALTPQIIKQFNLQVLQDLELPTEVKPGQIREHSVVVGKYRGPDAEQCEWLLHELCSWLNSNEFVGDGPMRIPIAIIRASLVHLYLAWIHAFADGNGRTARLCEYLVLVTSGVPTSAAHLISNHCNNTRDEYYRQLQYASEIGGDVSRFLNYCATGFVKELHEQLNSVYARQFRLTWSEYVGAQVPGRDLVIRERRRLIAEELFGRSVAAERVASLSPDLARTYAHVTTKTLARDLEELTKVGLLLRAEGLYTANTRVLLDFLPLAVPDEATP